MATKKILTDINLEGKIDVDGTVLGSNLSGTNTGDQDLSGYATTETINAYWNRGYKNSHQATNLPVGWYTIATNTGNRALAEFQIWDTASSDHQSVLFNASHHYGTDSSNDITVTANSRFSGTNFRYIRIKELGTYDGAALQVYVDGASNSCNVAIVGGNAQDSGWVIKDWVADATDPGDLSSYSSFTEACKVDLDHVINGGYISTGDMYINTDERVMTYEGGTFSGNISANNLSGTNTGDQVSSDFEHDDLSGYLTNEHIDWTTDQGSTNIHANNYTDTTYSVGDGGLSEINFTSDDHIKLNGIAAGAEVNVQSDWNATSGDAFIQNKPTTFPPSTHNHDDRYYTETESDTRFVNVAGDTITGNLTVQGSTILDSLQLESSSDYITFYGGNSTQHSITSRQLDGQPADDLRFNTYGSFIINLDSNNNQSTAAASSFYIARHGSASGDLSSDILFDINGENGDATFTGDIAVTGTVDGVDISALPTSFAPTNAEANVQSDWNATSGDAFIQNKPTIPTNNSQLTNGAGYITDGNTNWNNTYGFVTSSGNTIIGTDADIDTSGATIIDNLYMTDGVITSHGTRVLTLADLGYTGATNANNYTHPSYNGDDINLDTGVLGVADVISDLNIVVTTDTSGHVSLAGASYSTRTMTLANLGYTGATNANYITNNNQLTNGAGYTTYTANQNVNTTDSPTFSNLYVSNAIFHTGDTNTYTQFHAADQWRVVTAGAERLEVNNSQVTVANNLQVNGSIYTSQYIYHTGDTNTYMRFPSNDTISWNTAGSERMRINSSGNLGIGTTSPSQKLEVTGNAYFTGRAQASNAVMKTYSGHAIFGSNSTAVPVALGRDTANLDLVVSTSGNVGIGTTAPSYKLHVAGTTYANGSTIGSSDLLLQDTSSAYSTELKMQNNTHTLGIDYQNNEQIRFITRSGVTTVPITFQMRAGTITAANFILSSDERKKTKIEDLKGDALDVQWRSFEMKDNEGEYRTGVIAQELEQKHPEFVNTDDEGYKTVKYIDLLIAKVAELEARLEKVESNGCKKCK